MEAINLYRAFGTPYLLQIHKCKFVQCILCLLEANEPSCVCASLCLYNAIVAFFYAQTVRRFRKRGACFRLVVPDVQGIVTRSRAKVGIWVSGIRHYPLGLCSGFSDINENNRKNNYYYISLSQKIEIFILIMTISSLIMTILIIIMTILVIMIPVKWL